MDQRQQLDSFGLQRRSRLHCQRPSSFSHATTAEDSDIVVDHFGQALALPFSAVLWGVCRFLARVVLYLKRCQRADLPTVLQLGRELPASQNVDPSMHKVVNDNGETCGHPDSDYDGENDGNSRLSKWPAYGLRGMCLYYLSLPSPML